MHHPFDPTGIAAFLADWGYLGLFICVFVGNLGVPVPEETVLLAAGFLAGRDILELRAIYLVGIASAVSGDCAGYAFGRTGGQRLIDWLAATFRFLQPSIERLRTFFATHGAKAVFMARFVTGARFVAGPMAGATGMRFWRFLGWNLLGAIIWCGLVITVGYLVGDELEHVAMIARRAGHLAALGLASAALLLWLGLRRRRTRLGS